LAQGFGFSVLGKEEVAVYLLWQMNFNLFVSLQIISVTQIIINKYLYYVVASWNVDVRFLKIEELFFACDYACMNISLKSSTFRLYLVFF
jgi:hypothetical protein